MALLLVASMESYFREGTGRYWSPQSCSQALQLGTLDLEQRWWHLQTAVD